MTKRYGLLLVKIDTTGLTNVSVFRYYFKYSRNLSSQCRNKVKTKVDASTNLESVLPCVMVRYTRVIGGYALT